MLDDNIDKADGWMTGEDKNLVFTIYTTGTTRAQIDAGGATPQNVTGWTLSYLLKRSIGDADSDALISKTTSSGIALTTPASGIITVTIDDTDTDTLLDTEADAIFWQELKRTNAGLEAVLSQGQVRLRRSVHRS
jgi:hypothetical protein